MNRERVKLWWGYFTKEERLLWCASVVSIAGAFFLFDRGNPLTLAASLIGVTSLIFSTKGNPLGQLLMVLFSVLYGILSFSVAYYGEMMTYLGMTAPMAVFALVSWLRHPYQGDRTQVQVNRLKKWEPVLLWIPVAAVTGIFYGILKALNTASLALSTFSVTTSFLAVYLTWRRSPFFAAAYAANDLVLVVLWLLAARTDDSCLSMVICFVVFLVNDLYGLISWRRMQRRQEEGDGVLCSERCEEKVSS